jgi:hypothetical protein
MIKRCLSSRWWWLAICVVVGSLVITIPALTVVKQVIQIGDALSSGFKDGLGKADGSLKETRQMSVGFLFGLVKIENTPYPYAWTVVSGVITGGGSGLIVWLVAQVGLWVWRRGRGVPRHAAPGAALDE